MPATTPAESPPDATLDTAATTATTAADYGIALNELNTAEKAQFERQELFLKHFRKYGTKGACARRAGVARTVVWLWEQADAHSFRRRLKDAHEVYVNSQEELLQKLGQTMKHPVAIIARLNKESSEWNRPATVVINTDSQKILAMLSEGRQPNVVEGRWAAIEEGEEPPGTQNE